MSALEIINPARWMGRLSRGLPVHEDAEFLSHRYATPGIGGGCIRGFLFALAIEGVALLALAAVAWGVYSVGITPR